jgi:hypothetical protein
VNGEDGKPGIPVSARPAEFLALLAGMQDIQPGNEAALAKLEKAGRNWNVVSEGLDVLAGRDKRAAVLDFVRWWQQETLLRPDPSADRRDRLPFRPETEAHHHVLNRVIAARGVMLARAGKEQLPDCFSIPCRECGVLFTTAAPRFARTCTSCQRARPYAQRLGVHVTGALPVFLGGSYPRGPQRPQYAWSRSSSPGTARSSTAPITHLSARTEHGSGI